MLTPHAIQLLAIASERGIEGVPYVASPNQITALNILLHPFAPTREARLALINALLGLHVGSSKHLTHGQASALLQCAYPLDMPITSQSVNTEFAELVSYLNMEKI